jgi:hypothetical protein
MNIASGLAAPAAWTCFNSAGKKRVATSVAWFDQVTLLANTALVAGSGPPSTGTYTGSGGANPIRGAMGLPLANVTFPIGIL